MVPFVQTSRRHGLNYYYYFFFNFVGFLPEIVRVAVVNGLVKVAKQVIINGAI